MDQPWLQWMMLYLAYKFSVQDYLFHPDSHYSKHGKSSQTFSVLYIKAPQPFTWVVSNYRSQFIVLFIKKLYCLLGINIAFFTI